MIFGIVVVGPCAVGGETDIWCVGRGDRWRAAGCAPDHLVQRIVGERVGDGVVAEEQMVADVVVGVRKVVRADGGGKDFRTSVVGEC